MLLLVVAALSLAVLLAARVTPVTQTLVTVPGAVALITAIWQVVKLEIEHQNKLAQQRVDHGFALSATSHMADKAFDKHVEFSEKYVGKANEALHGLFANGPTEKALEYAVSLNSIRREYILWETPDVSAFLSRFERALQELGAEEHYLKHVPVGAKRTELVEKIHSLFSRVVEIEPPPNGATDEVAVRHIIEQLREHLGIAKLTSLRKFYLNEAMRQTAARRS